MLPVVLAVPLWWQPFAPFWPLPWFTAPTATATASPTARATRTPAPTTTPTPPPFVPGAVRAEAPYFAFRRPFNPPDVLEASRFYPFGTDAGGEYLMHHGIDIGNPFGTEVHAIGDGRVAFAGRDDVLVWGPTTDFYGQLVVIEHAERLGGAPLYSLYGHVSEALVRTGQSVGRGDVIARVGSEGIALGPHLHLEVRTRARDYAATINPELILEPLPGHGTIVGRVLDADGHAVPSAHVTLFALDDDGMSQFLFQATTYPPDTLLMPVDYGTPSTTPVLSPAWRWDENFLFADVPAGRYAVVCDAVGARAETDLAHGGAALVVLRAPASGP